MVGKFDYNNSDVMNILNNPSYTEDQKKALFEKYKSDLKETRRKEITARLNECAKNNPIIRFCFSENSHPHLENIHKWPESNKDLLY